MAESKEIIISAAIDEFHDMGYEGARVDNIAARSGLNKAMIYYHFENKEKLYIHVLESLVQNLILNIKPVVFNSGTIEEILKKIMDGYSRFFVENPKFPRIFFREIASGGFYLKDIFKKQMLPIAGILQSLLKQGISSGEIKDTDYKFAILSIIGPFIVFFLGQPIFEILIGKEYDVNTIDSFKEFIFETVYYGFKKR